MKLTASAGCWSHERECVQLSISAIIHLLSLAIQHHLTHLAAVQQQARWAVCPAAVSYLF